MVAPWLVPATAVVADNMHGLASTTTISARRMVQKHSNRQLMMAYHEPYFEMENNNQEPSSYQHHRPERSSCTDHRVAIRSSRLATTMTRLCAEFVNNNSVITIILTLLVLTSQFTVILAINAGAVAEGDGGEYWMMRVHAFLIFLPKCRSPIGIWWWWLMHNYQWGLPNKQWWPTHRPTLAHWVL